MKSKGVILLFVEWERFAKKILTTPLKDYFPDFEGGHDSGKAYEYIRDQFLGVSEQQTHRVYAHICKNDGETALKFITKKTQEIAMKFSLKSNSRTLPK